MIVCFNFIRFVPVYKTWIWSLGMRYGPQHSVVLNSIKFYGNVYVCAHTF